MMYSSIDTDDEYTCDESDNLVTPANEGRRLSDVGRYRQSRMRLKSSARRTFGSNGSGGGSSEQQRSISSSNGSFGADTSDSVFASFDSQSSRGSCCSLPATRQRTSLAKTPWPRKQNPRLLHQYSDSAVFSSRKMHQDLKMARLASEGSTDLPRKLPVEAVTIKGAKAGPHPRKKMLRSQSESAIDVSMIKPLKIGRNGSTGSEPKPIVVSNDDLLKILSEANKFTPSKRRSHKVASTLGSTLESPQEIAETDSISDVGGDNMNKKLLPKSGSPEKEGSKLKGKRVSPRISRHSSLHVNLPIRASLSTSSLRSRATDALQLSPVHRRPKDLRPITPPGSNKNCLVPPTNSVIRDRPIYGSTLPRCPSPSELEPIIKSDDNGNQLLEEDEEEAALMEEKQIQQPPKPQSTPSDTIENITEDKKESDKTTAFDPSLLGEAIERHLSLQKTSPSRKKTRSGAALWKGLWNQDKLGGILTKFPFKKDSSDGVTV